MLLSVAGPRFSVLVPAYNTAATVGPALDSVLAQTRGDFEVIVVDDGSVDDTAERVRPYERTDSRIRLVRQPNAGLAEARNTAIRHSRAPLLSLLDSDDLWMPDYLEAMDAALETNPEASLAYTDAWVFDDGSRRVRRATAMDLLPAPTQRRLGSVQLLSALLEGNFIIALATIRRSAIEAVGAFDARLRRCEDYELWLRLAAGGHQAVQAPGLHALYRKRSDSLNTSKTVVDMLKTNSEIYRTVAEDYPCVPEPVRAHARRRQGETAADLAAREGVGRRAAALRARQLVASVVRLVLSRRRYYSEPPAEVAAAFDLTAV